MEMEDLGFRLKLRTQFEQESGIPAFNSQGEPKVSHKVSQR